MKKILIGCGIAATLGVIAFVAIFAGVFFFTSGAATAADEFFALIANGDTTGAFAATAEEFRATTTQADFERYLESTSLTRFESASWSNRSVENNRATLSGTITTRDGGQIPITVGLVRESGQWRVLSVKKADAGLTTETGSATSRSVPDDAACEAMTRATVTAFAEAVTTEDFAGFYAGSSALWQSQTSPAELRQAFASFVDQQIDLRFLADETPVFSRAPSIDEQGALQLAGYYATERGQVQFELSYVYEHPEWKLIGIHVNL